MKKQYIEPHTIWVFIGMGDEVAAIVAGGSGETGEAGVRGEKDFGEEEETSETGTQLHTSSVWDEEW